tara:strand:+ start:299 stop:484 length:186 start_codon:yes stop_codon:yes gene_type:complete
MTKKSKDLADDLVLDILDRLENKNPNDSTLGKEVRALLVRIRPNTIQLLRQQAINNAAENS